MAEATILAAIIKQRDLESARQLGLLPRHFGNPRERAAYEFLLYYAETNNGDIPTKEIFLDRSGYDQWVDVPSHITVRSLAEQIIKTSLARELEQALPDPFELRRNPREVGLRTIEKMSEALFAHGGCSAAPVGPVMGKLAERAQRGELLPHGLPLPWPSLDAASFGLVGGDVTIIYGRPGTMKTWVLLSIIAHLMESRKDLTLMIVSCELSLDVICRRIASLLTRIPYQNVLRDAMTECEKHYLISVLELLNMGGAGEFAKLYYVDPDHIEGSEVQQQVEMLRPNALFIDNAYLRMDPNLDPQDRRSLAKGIGLMQKLARKYQIPVVATLHASRKKSEQIGSGGGDDLYGSDTISQRADVLYRLHTFDDDKGERLILLQVAKSREFPIGGIIIKAPPSGESAELEVLYNATAVEVELLKISNRAKRLRKVTSFSEDIDSGMDKYFSKAGRDGN